VSTNSFNIVFYHKDNLINNIRLKTIKFLLLKFYRDIFFERNNNEVINEKLILLNDGVINKKLILQ
jgi:hypothetical protein